MTKDKQADTLPLLYVNWKNTFPKVEQDSSNVHLEKWLIKRHDLKKAKVISWPE